MRVLAVSVNSMNHKPSLSAIILSKNEEARIGVCLYALGWAGERIVVDNGSTDKTAAIASQKKALVIEDSSRNFSKIRNAGAKRAKGEWLLYVDADEIVTRELRTEIERVVTLNEYNAYFIPRKNYYLGVVWPYEDGMVRLIRKKSLTGWIGVLHEHPQVKGKTGKLTNHLIHHTHRTLEEMVAKTNEWSDYEANLRFSAHHPGIVWWRLIRVMITAFWNSYFVQGGWKTGTVGLIESMYQSFSMFITYAKLWELQRHHYEKMD
jgi:glycosyltransferase involved in cell wall biosynthesis